MNDDIPTHAVKAVIKNEEGKILFLQRKPDPSKKVIPSWDFPGGIVEEGEEDKIALRREIQEELGVDSIVGDEVGKWTFLRPFDGNTVNVTNYSVQLLSQDIKLSHEYIDFKWVERSQAEELPVKDRSIFSTLGNYKPMTKPIDIYKAGGVILKDRNFLVTRSAGKDIFIAPGGKLENGETSAQALSREMKEEVQIDINTSTLEPLGTFIAQAAGKEDKTLQMEVFIIHDFNGEIIPSSEVEEVMWVNTLTKNVSLGSIFEHDVMPLLKQRDLID